MTATYTAFEYLYRDASNHKSPGGVYFHGAATVAHIARLRAALDGGDWFIAHQIRVPEVFLWGEETDYELNEDDHPWHEFSGLAVVERDTPPGPIDEYGRDVEAFVAEVEAVAAQGWAPFEPCAA